MTADRSREESASQPRIQHETITKPQRTHETTKKPSWGVPRRVPPGVPPGVPQDTLWMYPEDFWGEGGGDPGESWGVPRGGTREGCPGGYPWGYSANGFGLVSCCFLCGSVVVQSWFRVGGTFKIVLNHSNLSLLRFEPRSECTMGPRWVRVPFLAYRSGYSGGNGRHDEGSVRLALLPQRACLS